MSINIRFSKMILSGRILVIGLMFILSIAVTSGFVWKQAGNVIASPGLRLLAGLWRLFICRCPVFPDLLDF